MTNFAATIAIDAPVNTIWGLLTDAAGYPVWNSTVTKIEGRIAAGQKVAVHANSSPGRAFPLRVAAFEAPVRMVWTGACRLGCSPAHAFSR